MTQQEIIEKLAFSQIGRPYVWGGQSPDEGFDCSGFVIWVLQQVGLFPLGQDMTANDMWQLWNEGDGWPKDQDDFRQPYFIFYGEMVGSETGLCGHASHVMLMLNGNLCIGACGDAGVCVRPVNYRDDFLGFAAPRG